MNATEKRPVAEGNTWKWALLVLAAAVPVGLLSAYSYRAAARSLRAQVQLNNQAAAMITAELVSRDVERSLNLASTFAILPGLVDAVVQHDEEAVRARLRVVVESYPGIDRAFVTDPAGVLWSDYPKAPESLGNNFSGRDWYRGLSQAWTPYVSEVYQRQADPKPLVVAVAVPVRHDDKLQGALVYQYRLDGITAWLKQISVGEGGYVFVIDHTGTVAAHPRLDLQARSYDDYAGVPLVHEALGGAQVGGEYRDPLAGEEMVVTCLPVNVGGQRWAVVAQQPLELAYAPIRVLATQIAVAGIILAAGALAVAVALVRISKRNVRLNEELIQRNLALVAAKEAAEEASRTKSQFLANMSHELRTPLNSVIGFANVLLKNKAHNLRAEDLTFVERITTNGKHLLSLINQILDLSKIEAHKVELQRTSVALDELVRETIAQNEGQVRDRPVRLVAEMPAQVAPIQADADKLRQVLINLIGNALKFTDHGGVTVRVVADEATGVPTAIQVIDTGIGIPAERLGAIFEAFQQADASTARKYGGTGLGLTISQALCRLMGYQLEVASEPGQGSTFSIRLGQLVRSPLAAPVPPAAGPVAPEAVLALKQKLVLVIDDDMDARILLTQMIEEIGCKVVAASSGEQGLQMARALHPDLITVDLMMPEMNGRDVLARLRDDPQLQAIPAMVVSVVAGENRGLSFGVVDFIEKPVERDALRRAILRNVRHVRGRVLIVDDNEDARRIMASYLTDDGLEIREAAHGRAALEVMEQFAPDVVLLDLMMPEMDGLTFLQTIRADGRYRHLPVIVVTAKELTAAESQRLAREAQGVLKKADALESDLRRALHELLEHKPAAQPTEVHRET